MLNESSVLNFHRAGRLRHVNRLAPLQVPLGRRVNLVRLRLLRLHMFAVEGAPWRLHRRFLLVVPDLQVERLLLRHEPLPLFGLVAQLLSEVLNFLIRLSERQFQLHVRGGQFRFLLGLADF